MKIALAQINYHIGNFEENSNKIVLAIKKAKQFKVDLIIFSELSVCGYPPQDLLEQKEFIEQCEKSIHKIASFSKEIGVIVGGPSINSIPNGKNLFNSAFFLYDGKIQSVHHKTLLPTYDIFDEYRYFTPNREFNVIKFKKKKIAITICEDLWFDQPFNSSFGKKSLYTISPMEKLINYQPDFIINIAASPFSYTHEEIKKNIFIDNAKKYQLPIFYVNQIGAQTELIFEGESMVVNLKGQIVDEFKSFEEDFKVFDLNEINESNIIKYSSSLPQSSIIEKIHNALILGIKDYFTKMNFQHAIIGLSGGIDSAVTLVLATRALGRKNLRVLFMPSKFASKHSVTDAVTLANNLEVKYDIINIQSMVERFEKSLQPIFYNLPRDITEENIQARIRGTLLMALSNKFGNILLNTSNKSEAAVGYGTLYGDMNGSLSVLGDVYKSDVYKLARYINKNSEIIPLNTITKEPSAELRPNQNDSDSLPEYGILDKILFNYIELQKSLSDIVKAGIDKELAEKVIRLVNNNEYKRYQTPPILRISSKAFGVGRRMPLVAKY